VQVGLQMQLAIASIIFTVAPVTYTIKQMLEDRKTGGHPNLQVRNL